MDAVVLPADERDAIRLTRNRRAEGGFVAFSEVNLVVAWVRLDT
jgi:hypothetical protein